MRSKICEFSYAAITIIAKYGFSPKKYTAVFPFSVFLLSKNKKNS